MLINNIASPLAFVYFLLWVKFFHISLFAKEITYPVSRIVFEYGNASSDLPDLKLLENAFFAPNKGVREFQLSQFVEGFSSPLELTDDSLFRLGEIGVHFLKENGFEGIVALPSPKLIDPLSGEDLRAAGDHVLIIQLWVSVLNEVEVELSGLKGREKLRLEKNIQKQLMLNAFENKPIQSVFFDAINNEIKHSSRSNKVILTATESPGRVNALVRSSRKKSEKFSFSALNAGSPSTGKWLFNAEVNNDQLSGNDDRIQLATTVSNTGERHSLRGSYYLPFMAGEKLGVGIGLGYSAYDASTFAVTTLDFEGENLYGDIALSTNNSFLSGDRLSLKAEIGLKAENVKSFSSLSGSVDTSMLTPRLSMSLNYSGDTRIAQTSFSLFGNVLNINDADLVSLGGIDVNEQYARIVITHSEMFLLGKLLAPSTKYLSRHLLSFRLQVSQGLSKNRHLPHHQFITGGTGSVRGYPESPAAGDNGIRGSFEYRFPFLILDNPTGDFPLVWTMAPFIDWANTSVNQPMPWESDQTLLSAGLSIFLPLPYGIYASVDFAKPLRELVVAGMPMDGTRSNDYRIHGNVGWRF